MKSYRIDKRLVVKSYQAVKSNKGASGVDGQTIRQFEERLEDNLYKIWNRMSSGSYNPPAVKMVKIPKSDGKERKLGIPTVSDRIAQMVVKLTLEPGLEGIFHPDSYGYRPGKSAHQALEITRKRCWQYDWLVDIDIKGFFDNLDHDLVMKALSKHTEEKWIHLYIKRWLEAPVSENGKLSEKRTKGTPQGGVISPLLANLFMHYAFDNWMTEEYPTIQFARYADDIIVHAVSKSQAEYLLNSIGKRMNQCKLELHPEKTKIVYCKDGKRRGDDDNTKFDFLGYTFKERTAKSKYGIFRSFLPAISDKAVKKIRRTIKSWRLFSLLQYKLEDIGKKINSQIRGWINYYGKFYKSELLKTISLIEKALVKWVTRKYKKLKRRPGRARKWLSEIASRDPKLFAHWSLSI